MGHPARSGLISYWKDLTLERSPKVSRCSADSSHQWRVSSDDDDQGSKSRGYEYSAVNIEVREAGRAHFRLLVSEL